MNRIYHRVKAFFLNDPYWKLGSVYVATRTFIYSDDIQYSRRDLLMSERMGISVATGFCFALWWPLFIWSDMVRFESMYRKKPHSMSLPMPFAIIDEFKKKQSNV